MLGFTEKDVLDVLMQLEIKNYSSGPLEDESTHGNDVWIFGTRFEGTDLYIKLTLAQEIGKTMQTIVISFHEAKYPLTFPYGD